MSCDGRPEPPGSEHPPSLPLLPLEQDTVSRASAPDRAGLAMPEAPASPGVGAVGALLVSFIALVAIGWVSGALLSLVWGVDGPPFDDSVVRALAEERRPWLTATLNVVTWSGSSGVLIPLVAVVGFAALRRTGRWATAVHLAVALGGSIALNNVVKPLVDRPRPQVGQLVASATGYAFPSGHATQIAAVAVISATLGAALTGSRARKAALWSFAALTSLGVGFSRLYLGVHWPTDVFVGYLLGALWALIVASVIRRSAMRERHLPERGSSERCQSV